LEKDEETGEYRLKLQPEKVNSRNISGGLPIPGYLGMLIDFFKDYIRPILLGKQPIITEKEEVTSNGEEETTSYGDEITSSGEVIPILYIDPTVRIPEKHIITIEESDGSSDDFQLDKENIEDDLVDFSDAEPDIVESEKEEEEAEEFLEEINPVLALSVSRNSNPLCKFLFFHF
jgi:hypothetical protein